tara:strand:- start:2911 stop:3669 length:759 start_codon:yes stop_codon:yes gene_type:complete
MVRKIAQQNPSYVARLGKIDTSKGKVWIELKFPDGPPQEYERPGIELTEDLQWRRATRPVDPMHHVRLNRLLVPTEASNALYQDTKRKAALSWKSFRTYMGWEEKSEPDTVQSVVQRVLANPPPAPGSGVSVTPAATDAQSSPAAETKSPAQTTSSLGSHAKALGFVLPEPKQLTLDLSQFRQDFRKAFKPYTSQPPRGTFLVIGMIEIYGERARLTLNVAASYDPKQGRYVHFGLAVWNLVDHRQHPKGGP